jgi:hypothetical protein
MSPKRTTEGSYDSLLTEIEYATGRSMPIEIGQAPDSGHTQPAAEGSDSGHSMATGEVVYMPRCKWMRGEASSQIVADRAKSSR